MSELPRRGSILLVAHRYSSSSHPWLGSVRPRGLAKYLTRLGYEVTVLTSRVGGDSVFPSDVRVVRSADLLGTRLNWRRPNPAGVTAPETIRTKASLLSRLLVPDIPTATWIPFALPAANRIAQQDGIDCVITSSPPQSAHLIGASLRRRGVPWVADLRDGWRFEPPVEWASSAQRRLDGLLERRLLRRADHVVTVTEPIAADLRRRLGVTVTTVTNAYDPEEPETRAGISGVLDPDRHSLLYTGRLFASHGALRNLIAALRLLSPPEAERLELVVAGPLMAEEREFLNDPSLAGIVRYLGVLDRQQAMRLQRQADSLLLLAADARPSVASGKLFEYLSAGRPILVVGRGTQAARIASDSHAAILAPVDDPGRIRNSLLDLISGELAGFDPDLVAQARQRYAFPEIAERMAEVIERARAEARKGSQPPAAAGAAAPR